MIRKKLLIVHQGALGDFLLAWPGMLRLSEVFQDSEMSLFGSSERMLFLGPLGIHPARGQVQAAGACLYGAENWPDGLENTLVIWFGLRQPPTAMEFADLWFLPGISDQGSSVRRMYLQGLQARGVEIPDDFDERWPGVFRKIALPRSPAKEYDLLIFPGSGHMKKQWPLVKYFELAKVVQAAGFTLAFVLGPAEAERGLAVSGFPVRTLETLPDLIALLGSSRAVLGNDCGPMHLAGMLGIPGAALFGPTSATQWEPWNIIPASLGLACQPCTLTTADISCRKPECLEKLEVEQVWPVVSKILML